MSVRLAHWFLAVLVACCACTPTTRHTKDAGDSEVMNARIGGDSDADVAVEDVASQDSYGAEVFADIADSAGQIDTDGADDVANDIEHAETTDDDGSSDTGPPNQKCAGDGDCAGPPCGICVQGTCEYKLTDCACQSDSDCTKDANKCAPAYFCDKSAKVHQCLPVPNTVKVCAAASACETSSCDPQSGACVAKPADDGKTCDDGNACTANTTCKAGKCGGGLLICQCQQDADCAKLDDGNFCNGTMVCDKSGATPKCLVPAASVVVCPSTSAMPCLLDACDPKTGKCIVKPTTDGKVCDDGDPCTASTVCATGQCQGGTAICACQGNADCAKYDDANLCNGSWSCDPSGATPKCTIAASSVVQCPAASSPCVTTGCDPKNGQCGTSLVADDLPCDDGDGCTTGSTCKAGKCQGGANTCQCQQDADCAKIQSNPCFGQLICDKSGSPFTCKVKPGSAVVCPAGPTCTKSTCNPQTGLCAMAAASDGTSCSDGDPCTIQDSCKAGACVAGANSCLCSSDADCNAQDANLCDGISSCEVATGKCIAKPNSAVTCSASKNTLCVTYVCDPELGGCNPTGNSGVPCDDLDECTKNDACNKWGLCTGTVNCECKKPTDCDDGDDCTTEGCDGNHKCTHVVASDGTSCGLLGCKGVGTCSKGACLMPGNATWFQKVAGAGLQTTCGLADTPNGIITLGYDSTTGDAVLRGYGTQANLLWSHTLPGDEPAGRCSLLTRADGTLAGHTTSDVFLANAAGQISSDQAVCGKTATCIVTALVDRGVAGLAFTGGFTQGAQQQFGLGLVDAAGKPGAVITFPSAGAGRGQAIALLADGSLVLGGYMVPVAGKAHVAVVLRTDAAAAVQWQKEFTANSVGFDAVTAIAVTSGGMLVAGQLGYAAWIARLDDAGNLLWQKSLDEEDVHVARTDGDGFLLAMHVVSAGRLARIDAWGNQMWKSNLPWSPSYTVPLDLLRRGNGALGIVGALDLADGFVGQTDPWGHPSCGASGSCGGSLTCDDGELCTADSCSADAGCTHTALAGGSQCGAGKTCSSGGCK